MNYTGIKRDFGEEGFAEHYNARIRPRLAEFEAMRRKWLLLWLATLVLVGAIAVGVVVYACVDLLSIQRFFGRFFSSFDPSYLAVFIIGVFLLRAAASIMRLSKLKKGIMPSIYDFFKGDELQYHTPIPKNLANLALFKFAEPQYHSFALAILALTCVILVGVVVFSDVKFFPLFILFLLCVPVPRGVAITYRRKFKKALVPIIIDFFNDEKLQYHTSQGEQIGRSGDISIRGTREVARKLYSYTDLIVDDGFTGTHLGYDFLIDEVKITQTSGSGKNRQTVTLFNGLVLGIAGNRLFADEVLLRRRGQTPNGEKFQRVLLENVQFEKKFDAFGTDQIAARRLLEPRKMELIMAVAGRISSSDTPEFMFLEDGFFLFIPSDKDHFEPGGITTSVYEIDTIKRILTDIRVVLSLIEILLEEKILPEKVHD
ncbi:MAG: DUF3137 domain-containing protein [Betaproteobacteria bacterium]|nr:DUF3137 domain-containing protein [Betaproteobacteria bacterium]